MIQSKKIGILVAAGTALTRGFTIVFSYFPGLLGITASEKNAVSTEYAEKLFDKSSVTEIAVTVDPDAWEEMLENAAAEEYIACDVTIAGTTFTNVGIRPKGNTSLSQVASSDSDRYSFKFQFDEYIDGQTCFGLDKFVANNLISDATCMKEYLSYDLMGRRRMVFPGKTEMLLRGRWKKAGVP